MKSDAVVCGRVWGEKKERVCTEKSVQVWGEKEKLREVWRCSASKKLSSERKSVRVSDVRKEENRDKKSLLV